MSVHEHDPVLQDRVVRLMRYLQGLVTARTTPNRDVDCHERVIWARDLPDETSLAADAGPGDVVLRVRRMSLELAPRPPATVVPWLRGDIDDSSSAPSLTTHRSDVSAEFERWLTDWRLWADVDRRRRPVAQLYQALTRVLRELEFRPESVEFVLASGLLTLPERIAGQDIRIHLIAAPVLLTREQDTGDMVVRLDPNREIRLEDTQPLTGVEVFDSSGSRVQAESLVNDARSPIDESVPVFLKGWAERALSVRVATDGTGGESSLDLEPALVLRARSSFALVDYYRRIIQSASEHAAVPLGIAQLVTPIEPADRLLWLDRTGASAAADLVSDPLFPLPANDEQREIIHRLGRDSGVVVEGPPGTGKTHTIANLVSALLAQGQRVLVTSEKAQALRVLRDKLPEPMQDLCVSVTDAGRGGSTELNRSVAEMATRKASFSAGLANERIDELARKRDQARRRKSMLSEEIRGLRESETFDHPEIAPGYSGKLARIVERVVAEQPRCGWLPGPLRDPEPPFGADGFNALIRLTAASTPERERRRSQSFPSLDGVLPADDELARLCRSAAVVTPAVHGEAAQLLDLVSDADPATLDQIRAGCAEIAVLLGDLSQHPMVHAAADGLLSGRTTQLWGRAPEVDRLLHTAQQADQFVGVRAVTLPTASRQALDAYSALALAIEHREIEWRRFRKSDQQRGRGARPDRDGRWRAGADRLDRTAGRGGAACAGLSAFGDSVACRPRTVTDAERISGAAGK